MAPFGARLRDERERRGSTLEEISASTKISVRFLRALEEENFEQLPGGIFNKGFVRAYARHLGLDEEQLITDYLDASGENEPLPPAPDWLEPPQTSPEEATIAPNRVQFHVPWAGLAAFLIVLSLGLAIWGFHTRETPSQAQVRHNTPVTPVQTGGAKPAPQPVTPPKPSGTTSVQPGSVSPQPGTLPTTTMPTTTSAQAPVATTLPTPNAPATPNRPALVLVIEAEEECWISLNVDGKPSEITLGEGERHVVKANSEILLRAGNVGALDFWLNGKPLPWQGNAGAVKTLAFDANGVRPVTTTAARPN